MLWTGGLATAVVAALIVIVGVLLARGILGIVALATLAAIITPFTRDAELGSKITTALVNLALGIALISLLSGVARSALRRSAARRSYDY
jgi:uncharacterized protein YhhL (DUF1145 family)